MTVPNVIEPDLDPARKVYPDMPNHAASEAEFLTLVSEGLADIKAGRTTPFETVAMKFRAKIYGRK